MQKVVTGRNRSAPRGRSSESTRSAARNLALDQVVDVLDGKAGAEIDAIQHGGEAAAHGGSVVIRARVGTLPVDPRALDLLAGLLDRRIGKNDDTITVS
jgi:hypothetical protein